MSTVIILLILIVLLLCYKQSERWAVLLGAIIFFVLWKISERVFPFVAFGAGWSWQNREALLVMAALVAGAVGFGWLIHKPIDWFLSRYSGIILVGLAVSVLVVMSITTFIAAPFAGTIVFVLSAGVLWFMWSKWRVRLKDEIKNGIEPLERTRP